MGETWGGAAPGVSDSGAAGASDLKGQGKGALGERRDHLMGAVTFMTQAA